MAEKKYAKAEKSKDRVAAELKQRRVSLPRLRRILSAAKKASVKKSAPDILQSQRFNLKVFDTQLKTLEDAIGGDFLAAENFNELPVYKQQQLITRLENINQRALKKLGALGKDDTPEDIEFQNHSFTCLNDFNKCMKLKAASPFWCNLAFYICFLRSISPFIK